MPLIPLPSLAEPAAFVPIRLPCTRFADAVAPWMTMPLPVLPEMTFPAPAAVPADRVA